MKTYKFTINGNKYSVEVGDIENNEVNVEVNGSPYQVELDTEIKGDFIVLTYYPQKRFTRYIDLSKFNVTVFSCLVVNVTVMDLTFEFRSLYSKKNSY